VFIKIYKNKHNKIQIDSMKKEKFNFQEPWALLQILNLVVPLLFLTFSNIFNFIKYIH